MPRVEPEVRRAAELFTLLADPTRLSIAMLLRESPVPVRLAEIKAEISPTASQTTFSSTIRPLVSFGLVGRLKRGKESHYELTAEARGRLEPVFELVARLEPRR